MSNHRLSVIAVLSALLAAPLAVQAQSADGAPQTLEQRVAADAQAAGQAAAAAWLALLDAAKYGDAWDTASTLFRSRVPKQGFVDGMPNGRGAFGAAKERRVEDIVYKTTLEGQPNGQYVSVLFVSNFANKSETAEIVTTMREADGRWRVTGYSTR